MFVAGDLKTVLPLKCVYGEEIHSSSSSGFGGISISLTAMSTVSSSPFSEKGGLWMRTIKLNLFKGVDVDEIGAWKVNFRPYCIGTMV